MYSMLKDIIQETCNNTVLWMLVAVITFDYITGVIKGALWKVNDSQVGMKGLIKHGLVLAGFLVAYPFASIMDATGVVNIVAILYILNYVISIIENFGVMGVYVPPFLENKVKSEITRYEKMLSSGKTARELERQAKDVKVTVQNNEPTTFDIGVSDKKVDTQDLKDLK